ncbi:MAG: DUF2805 domain-containing protein [Pseudomonadota bacterium]
MPKLPDLDDATRSQVIELALSDHVSFDTIRLETGLSPDQVKSVMRQSLKPGSYRAWRKRVRDFGTRREYYK